MSSVRMCDKCNTVFSELEDGWQSYRATTARTDPDTGRRETVELMMDACPACSFVPHMLRDGFAASASKRALDARITSLEKATGVGQPEPAAS